jgi:type VI secretion system Hcp family effector
MLPVPRKLHHLALVAALATVATSAAALATPITSAANAPQSGISPGGVDMATGEIILVCRPDLALDGPIPVVFGRYYASMLGREGLASGRMGPNWLGTYDWKLNVSGSNADVITGSGKDVKFQMPPAGGSWMLVSPLDQAYVLSFSGGTYRFTDPTARRVYLFSGSPLKLAQILDEHGNSLMLTYSGSQLAQVSDGQGRMLTLTYDPFAGMLSSITDGTRTVSYSYTGGTLTGFVDAAGQRWSYAYVSPAPFAALLVSVGEPMGNTPIQNSYDGLGRAVSQTDVAGGVAHYAWDAPSGNLFTDPLGRAWTYLHDSQNRLVSLTDPNSQVWSRAYDASGRLTSETRPLGDLTTYSYDPASGYPSGAGFADGSASHWTYGSHTMGGGTFFDLASVQFPDLTTESFTRDAAGNPTSITDRGGFHWQTTYNGRGQVLTATNPAGGVTSLTYDAGGRPISAADPAGNVTRYAYDALSRLITLAPDDTSSMSWTYDPLDHVLSAIDERGKTQTYQYDTNGRLTGATDPLSETTHYAYDGLDRLTQVTDPSGNATTFAFDAQGQVASTTDGTRRSTNYSYNVWGDFSGLTDATSASWTYGYDSNRRVTQAQDPLGHSAAFTYDAVDRLTHLTDPIGTGFDFGYDAMDRLHSETGPLGFSHTYGYDARGLMTSAMNVTSEYDFARNSLGGISQFTDPNRNASPFSYDSQGRLTMVSDPLARSSSYSYDARSRLIHATLPVNSASFMYDGVDRLLGVSITDGTSLAYNYDDANRLTGGTGVAFAYDAGGRMISSNGLGIAYDAAGRVTSESYGPAQMVSYAYDARGALTRVTDWMGGVTAFSYDVAGNLTGVTRPNGTTGTYAYNAAGRLVNAVERGPGLPSSPISSIAITRDALEQPTAVERLAPLLPAVQTPGTTNLAYDAASQVAGPTWDGLGRLTGDGSRALVWDGASRLESYTSPGESQSFGYDAFGRPLSHTQGAASEQYQWNYANGSPTLDVVMNGATPVRYFIHTPSGMLLESIEGGTGARHYYHYDENGNTIFLTDDAGAVTAEYAYGPYGDVRSSGATANNPFTLGGAGGVMQLGGSGFYELTSGCVYDTKFARMVSGGAIASGSGGPMNGPMNGPLNGPMNGPLNGPMNGPMNGPLNGPLNGPMNGPLNGPMNGPMNSPMNMASGLMEEEGIYYFFGHQEGGHHLNGPRIGHEVVVDFLEGDPDRPIVTGSGAGLGVMTRPWTIDMPMSSPGNYGHGVSASMYIDDMIGGRAQGKGNEFEISDFSFGVTNRASIGSATSGAGSGKAEFREFTIKRPVDSASPIFFKNCCAGSHYKTVVIQMRKAGGEGSGKPYVQYRFGLVAVKKIDWSGPGDEGPEETITFEYGALEIQYQPQSGGGGVSTALSPYWKNSTGSASGCLWCPH